MTREIVPRPEFRIVEDKSYTETLRLDMTETAARAQVAVARARYLWPIVAVGVVVTVGFVALMTLGAWLAAMTKFDPWVCGVVVIALGAALAGSGSVFRAVLAKLVAPDVR